MPIINAKMQSAGREYCAKVLEASDGSFSIVVAQVYANKNLKSFVRTFKVEDNQGILIDEFRFKSKENQVKERFILKIKPYPNENLV